MWGPGETRRLKKHGRRPPGPPDTARAPRGRPLSALLPRGLLRPQTPGTVAWAVPVRPPHPAPRPHQMFAKANLTVL